MPGKRGSLSKHAAEIRNLYATTTLSADELAYKYRCNKKSVQDILNHRTYKNIK